jgi:hypothetical protein
MQRRRFKQFAPLDQRLSQEAGRVRKGAKGAPPGIEREKLIRRARQAETAAHAAHEGVAYIAQPASAPLMPEHRAYIVGHDGHFNRLLALHLRQ